METRRHQYLENENANHSAVPLQFYWTGIHLTSWSNRISYNQATSPSQTSERERLDTGRSRRPQSIPCSRDCNSSNAQHQQRGCINRGTTFPTRTERSSQTLDVDESQKRYRGGRKNHNRTQSMNSFQQTLDKCTL